MPLSPQMTVSRLALTLLALACLPLAAVAASEAGERAVNPEALQIRELPAEYELSVPVSKLVLTLPKGGLAREKIALGGSTANPRYFNFKDEERSTILSGWFESARRF